ncbi:MAG: hypothetical protein IT433_00765 [Phycisphaerales bacterium]|nr:hypothetical protein [Phycisphaerales bacterium]
MPTDPNSPHVPCTPRFRGLWLPLLIGAGLGLLGCAVLGPVVVSRSISAAPGEAPVEWRAGDGAPINGAWVLDDHPKRAPARGIREIRADRPLQLTERVLGVAVRRSMIDHPGEWTALPAGLGFADALACAAAGALAAWLLRLLAGVVGSVAPAPLAPTRPDERAPAWPGIVAVFVAALVHGKWALTSPIIFCPDSMDYAVRAMELAEHGDFRTFDALRTPGFGVVIAALTAAHMPLATSLGVLHTLVAACIAWAVAELAGSMLGPGRPAGMFALAAALAATLDPVMLLWSRHAMPEMLAAGLTTLAVWAAWRAKGRWVWWAVLCGAFAAGAAYMRGNLQVVVALCPCLVFLVVVRAGGRRRALAASGLCVLCAVLIIAPWVLRNARTYGVAALAIGTHYARVLNAADAGELDLNQSAAFGRDQAAALSSMGPHSGFEVIRQVDGARLAAGAGGNSQHPWVASEGRLRIIADESAARWPDRRWRAAARGAGSLSGLWPLSDPGFREHEWWGSAWRTPGRTNFWNRPGDYVHLDAALTQRVYDQNVAPVQHQLSDSAWSALGGWRWARVALALASLVACASFCGARLWAQALMCLLPWTHAIALAALTGTGIDRYQAPLVPLGTLAGVLGLWCVLRGVIRRAKQRTPTPAA